MIECLDMPDADVRLYRSVFSAAQSAKYLRALLADTSWEQHQLVLFGRRIAAPRLSAWYGDADAVYAYSGLQLSPQPWTALLNEIRQRVEALASARFNSVLLNRYRDGNDSMGWHSDDEPELGRNPIIASVSFGATRRFKFRHRKQGLRATLDLDDGSVLVMAGSTQHHWQHHLPKTKKALAPRINLTFRRVKAGKSSPYVAKQTH